MEKKKNDALDRYLKKTRRRYVVNLNKNTDSDLLEHLEKIKNVQGYIKSLVREDMEKGSNFQE